MKIVLCVYALLLPLAGCDRGGGPREFNGDTALAYIRTQLEFGPRVPNTPGHQKTADWIIERIRATADSVEIQPFIHVTARKDTLRLRNIIGRFRPEQASRILYVAHWDTRPVADQSRNLGDQQKPVPGANDGGSGVAVLLGVADALKKQPPTFGVDLLFVDGEDYGDMAAGDMFIGSRHYAAGLANRPKPLFAIIWDMVGDADLTIAQEGHSVASAPEVVQRVWGRARELGYGKVFRDEVGYSVSDDHIPLLEAGVRAIDVIDFWYGGQENRYWHTLEDTIDKVSAKSLQVVGDVAVSLLR